jgi:hypothetical protein
VSPESRLQAHICPNIHLLIIVYETGTLLDPPWRVVHLPLQVPSPSRTKLLATSFSSDPTEINRVQHIHVENRIGKIISIFRKVGNKVLTFSLEDLTVKCRKKFGLYAQTSRRNVSGPYIGRSSRHVLVRRGMSANHCQDA